MKSMFLILGILFVITGIIGLIFGSIYFRYLHKISITESILWILFGSVFILLSSKLRKRTEYSICPECKNTYFYNKLKKGKCPECKIETIDIEKYYE